MKLYYNPISSYSQKTLTGLYEKGVEFEPHVVNLMSEEARAEYRELYPIGKIPLLIADNERFVPESSIILEYIDQHYDTGPQLFPQDPDQCRQVRFKDRMLDLYLNDKAVTLLFQSWKPEDQQDPDKIAECRNKLDVMYGYLDKDLGEHEFMHGDTFTVADCAALPALFYADQVHPFSAFANLTAYFERQRKRESYQRVLAEAKPILAKIA